MGPLTYRALIDLKSQELVSDGLHYPLNSGMQAVAEINLGTRTVLEYVLRQCGRLFMKRGENARVY